ncbi:Flp pilus assembly protein CpaB [Siminovitchia acidinfaciens]|uniref:Flp pilus assembly protein CpaB n=1 Tax=Siminovitchia acidinfaciens TaxID=2321395 RepID=A0A429XSX9_9BACI|nr:Flp pilus assembly protein CpaB [Siminovitchia acidinfaciens]RST70321.1 Flp pilus assembly protein CpaB [Siminovitchia acidinfaciens]
MNTKKIWLFAMVLGLMAAGFLYVMINDSQKGVAQEAAVAEEEPEEKEVTEEPEEETPPPLTIAKGKRAITVEVSDVQGVAGNVKAGSFVDVVAIMVVPEEYKEKQHDAATLLLQNVKVLEVGHAADDEEAKKRYQMVTLEVTSKEGLALGFATKHELYLMLRQEGDEKVNPKHTHIHEDDLHEGVFR